MQIRQSESDIAILDENNNPIALIEVKAMSALNRSNIDELYHNYVVRGVTKNTAYFFILTQQIGGLWQTSMSEVADPLQMNTKVANEGEKGRILFDTTPIIEQYFHADYDKPLIALQLYTVFFNWFLDMLYHSNNGTELPHELRGNPIFNEFIARAKDGNLIA